MPPLSVAVVDDDDLVRVAMGNLIRSFGYPVRMFEDGPSLLADDLDALGCVITDMQMPGMSGLVLQEELSARAPGLAVIFVTAFPNDWARNRAMNAGACGFFVKPCDPDELASVLDDILGPGHTTGSGS